MFKRAIVLLVGVAVAVAFSAPAVASCGTAAIIGTIGGPGQQSWVMTSAFQQDANFLYYYGTPSVYGSPVQALSANANITFWRQGSGDPAVGLGDDSGTYDMIAAGGFYAYGNPAFTFYNAGEIAASWFTPGIDGCVLGNSCMCVLLTDNDGDQSFYAVVAGTSDANFNTFINLGGSDGNGNEMPIVLQPVPVPTFVGSSRPFGGNDVQLDLTIGDAGGANYAAADSAGCACGPVGYKVLQQSVANGAQPPSGRDLAGWTESLTAAGGAQGVTPIGSNVSLRMDCTDQGSDLYIATQMFFDSGFSNTIVSANSARVECDPNLADPNGTKPVRPNGPRNDRPTNPRRR